THARARSFATISIPRKKPGRRPSSSRSKAGEHRGRRGAAATTGGSGTCAGMLGCRMPFQRSLDLVRFLRAHCPWDAEQTPTSLLPLPPAAAHDDAEAGSDGDDALLVQELGDLRMNVAFQTVLAEERGASSAEDVVSTLEEKMRRRHPHLYGLGPQQ